MKWNMDKLKEIYGESIIWEIKENLDSVVANMNYIKSIGFSDPYDVIETNPYLFLLDEENFKDKIEKLTQKLGVNFVEKLEEDSSLWGDIDD